MSKIIASKINIVHWWSNSRDRAANIFDCDKQTIANFEREGLIKRYGRGKMIRYSFQELKKALGIME